MSEHGHAETPLQAAQRHVDTGQARIRQQEQLIAELKLDGHNHLLPLARDLLWMLREIHAMAEAQLAREIARSACGKAK